MMEHTERFTHGVRVRLDHDSNIDSTHLAGVVLASGRDDSGRFVEVKFDGSGAQRVHPDSLTVVP